MKSLDHLDLAKYCSFSLFAGLRRFSLVIELGLGVEGDTMSFGNGSVFYILNN